MRARRRQITSCRSTGPAGGLYDECLFNHEPGAATVFIPVTTPRELGRVKPLIIPAAEVAVTTYQGPHADIDLAYARLGSYVAEHELDGRLATARVLPPRPQSYPPITRQWRTEIAWPIIDSPAE